MLKAHALESSHGWWKYHTKRITVKMNWEKHQPHNEKNKHATTLKQIFSGVFSAFLFYQLYSLNKKLWFVTKIFLYWD